LLLNVGFQDVDWGSTTRRSELRWRPEDAFRVASDSVRPVQSHGEPKGPEGSSLPPRRSKYQAQPFASRANRSSLECALQPYNNSKRDISIEL